LWFSASLYDQPANHDLKTDPAGNSGDRIACGVVSK
jgi:Cu/Zn superoxide dismutase